MDKKEETCHRCRRSLILGMHLVERFYASEKRTLTFHAKPCFVEFMAKLEARRTVIFEKEQERITRAKERGTKSYSIYRTQETQNAG